MAGHQNGDFGGSWLLPRIVGIQKAKELMMTSNEINGSDLDKLNVLYKLCNSSELDSEFKLLIDTLNKLIFWNTIKSESKISGTAQDLRTEEEIVKAGFDSFDYMKWINDNFTDLSIFKKELL